MIKILCVEDNYTDAELIRRELMKGDFEFEMVVVDSKPSFMVAVEEYSPDLILCDHTLPSFSSTEAMSILKENDLLIPFILVTGSMSDEVAATIVRNGADDYILKSALKRLPIAVINAVEKFKTNREKKKLLWKVVEYEDKIKRDLFDLNQKLLIATKAAGLAVWEYYLDADLVVADQTLRDVLGFRLPDNVRSLHEWMKFIHPDDCRAMYNLVETCRQQGGDFNLEFRMVAPDASIEHISIAGVVEREPDGGRHRIIGIAQNITKKKLFEKNLQDNETRYRSIWENSLDAIFVTVPNGTILAANPAACELFKCSEEYLKQKGRGGIMVDDENARRKIQERLQLGKASGEMRFVKADGTIFPGEVMSNVFHDASGRKRTITAIRDVSERKSLEDQLLKQKEMLTDLFEVAPSGIGYLSGPQHIYEMANRRYVQWTQRTDIIGKPVLDVLPELKDHVVIKILDEVYQTGKPFHSGEMHFPILDTSNQPIDVYLDFVYLPDTDQAGKVQGIYFFANDVSEQVLLRNSLAEGERNYRKLFDISPLPKFVVRKNDMQFVRTNAAASNVYGYTAEEFSSLSLSHLFTPDQFADVERALNESNRNGMSFKLVAHQLTRSGKQILVELSAVDFTYLGASCFLIVANDITEYSRLQQSVAEVKLSAQKKITQAQIKGQEKEKEFIGKELHDNINQQLCTIQLLLSMAKGQGSASDEIISKVDSITRSAISDIRSLSKSLVPPTLKDIGLSVALDELVRVFEEPQQFKIDYTYSPQINEIDPDLQMSIYRIIQEQLSNITKHAKATNVILSLDVKKGNLHLLIGDNGVGFDVHARRKGIGFANVKNRVELFNGKLKINSKPGCGCQLQIKVPLDVAGKTLTPLKILIAEDDAVDQELIRNTIRSIPGEYDLQIVSDGKSLLEMLAGSSDEQLPSLIILDYNLPLMNGLGTLKVLKDSPRFSKIVKVVYSTSYHKSYEDLCKAADAKAYMKKGITPEEIKTDILQMLNMVYSSSSN